MKSDYQRVATIIEHINAHPHQQLSLNELAEVVYLSPHHVHRMFSQWAGITPKQFLQALTLERAKRMLNDHSVLASSLEVGLSSNSRLHEHFITIDAVTPGEFKNQGKNLTFQWGVGPTLFGTAFIAWTDRGIHQLRFIETNDEADDLLQALRKDWLYAKFEKNPSSAQHQLEKIITKPQELGNSPDKLSLWVKGTNFQVNTWKALLSIPVGAVSTYGEIAKQLGKESASRAVGNAIGSNPIALLIPCHRVIQKSGKLGGYRWGGTRKQAILACELSE